MGGGTGITCEAGRITVRDRGLIRHVENFKETPMVKSVMKQRSSFAGQVLDSYDVSCASGVDRPDPGSYRLNPLEPQQHDYVPHILIDFLGGFVDEPIDILKLGYHEVRDDIQRWTSFTQRFVRPVTSSLGYAVGVAGVGVGMAAPFIGLTIGNELRVDITADLFRIGIPGFMVYGLAASRYADPRGTNGEAKEFSRLHRSAIEADEFMNDVYFPYFVGRTLREQEAERNLHDGRR